MVCNVHNSWSVQWSNSSRLYRYCISYRTENKIFYFLFYLFVPARHPMYSSLAGRYDNPMPELTLSPQSGSMNSATGYGDEICSRCSTVEWLTADQGDDQTHRLNMELDLQKFIWAPCAVLCTAVLIGWYLATPPPPAFGLIFDGSISQPR